MAAVAPPESPERRAEEADASGGRDADARPRGSERPGEAAVSQGAAGPDRERRSDAGKDGGGGGGGGCSRPEVSVESAAGADKTTCSASEDRAAAAGTAEPPGRDQWALDWSEPEEDGGAAKTRHDENSKSGPKSVARRRREVRRKAARGGGEGEGGVRDGDDPRPEQGVAAAEAPEEPAEDKGEADRAEAADPVSTAKPRRCRLMCKECGKSFNRRETFNLHRHFHAHEDELSPLTCKECGLTFQHRSSLIKHRNEHKEKEEQVLAPKKDAPTEAEKVEEDKDEEEAGGFECAECERVFPKVEKLRDHNCSNTADKPYHCPLCRQEFQFKVSVTKHMMLHSQEVTYACKECNQTFQNNTALRLHQRCHSALKPYECPECGMVFKHYSVMEDHRRKHTDNARSHLCNICGKIFKYSSLLHQHQYLHTGQKPFRCPECGKKFAFAQNMKAHCRQHRLRDAEPPPPPPPPAAAPSQGTEDADQSEEPKRTFGCPLCTQTYSTPAILRAHMLVHEAEYETLERSPKQPKESNKYWDKGHTCPHCPSIFRDELSLKLHMLSAHKSVAPFLDKGSAASPQTRFSSFSGGGGGGEDDAQGKWKGDGANSKSHKCSECGKAFRHRSVLELHMRIHSKDKPYQCKVCGKGFRFSSYLQQHLIIHTGKKPYKCPDCGKDFAFLQNMRTHQKLHQEKPFRCTSCRKGYSDETQLQHHMLSHNGDKPHKCDLCDKSFGLAYLLRDHMNTHTGERPHRCDECNKSFSWFSSLLVHQKIHARKRQGFGQYNSHTVGGRMRGRGGRGRRGGRPAWGLSRSAGSSGTADSQPPPYTAADPPQSSVLSSHVDSQAALHPPPVQWKVDGGEVMPVPSSPPPQPGLHHRRTRTGRADDPSGSQSGAVCVRTSETAHGASVVVPKKSSPSWVSELEQHRQSVPLTWSSTAASATSAPSNSLQQEFSPPSTFTDGAALWSVRPAPQANSQNSPNALGQELQPPRWPGAPGSPKKEPSTPPKKEDARAWDSSNPQVIPTTVSQPEKPWSDSPGVAGASTSAQLDQSGPTSASASHGVDSAVPDLQTPPGVSKTANSPEKLVNNQDFQPQQKQGSPSWSSAQNQTATQKVPVAIQYEGVGTPVRGFQNNPAGPQTVLGGQLKPGNGQDVQQQQQQQQQQQPMVTATQIIINSASPFFTPSLAQLPSLALPGSHPLHSVAVASLPRPPAPNIIFAPQLAPQTEPPKPGPRLPFAPDRLLQCMICGCSLPRELDLQMHYLQHAQGEI